MWICFNDAFVSIVTDNQKPGNMLVRARSRAHLANVFPKRKITETTKSDYRWRVSVPKAEIAKLVAERITAIDYDNFKDSVREPRLHDMYATWWQDHYRYQNRDKKWG